MFAIVKAPNNLMAPLFLAGPSLTGYLKYNGILESADQVKFRSRFNGDKLGIEVSKEDGRAYMLDYM